MSSVLLRIIPSQTIEVASTKLGDANGESAEGLQILFDLIILMVYS